MTPDHTNSATAMGRGRRAALVVLSSWARCTSNACLVTTRFRSDSRFLPATVVRVLLAKNACDVDSEPRQ